MVLRRVRYLQIQTESKLIRLGLYGLMILIGFSIIGSQSRGAFLGGCTIAAFLIWKSRQRLLLSLLVVAFLAVGALFVPRSWLDRMQTNYTSKEDGSALLRIEVWSFALSTTKARPSSGRSLRVNYPDAIH